MSGKWLLRAEKRARWGGWPGPTIGSSGEREAESREAAKW